MEICDFGTTQAGMVNKFRFAYVTTRSNPGTITVRFWEYVTSSFYPHYTIRTINVSGLNGSPNGSSYLFYKEVELSESQQFEVYSGQSIGYSFEFSNADTGAVLASGGAGNVNQLWLYDDWTYYWYNYSFNSWGGCYMQLIESAPTTCDIKGYKFNDTDGDGTWDAGEPAMDGWEFYLDENGDGVYQTSEPNVVTDPNGMYLFKKLEAPAVYTVREVPQNGWTQTLPGSGLNYEYVINAEPNNVYKDRHFGNTTLPPANKISGYVRLTDGTPVGNVRMETYDNGVTPTGEIAYTNATGYYELSISNPWTGTVVAQRNRYEFSDPTYFSNLTSSTAENVTATCLYDAGDGTSGDPFQIRTAEQMNSIGAQPDDWDKYFVLVNDIDLAVYSGSSFNMIGAEDVLSGGAGFTGVFDGDNHTISNFEYIASTTDYIGLFRGVNGGQILNLGLEDVNLRGADYTAALAAEVTGDAVIENCWVNGGSVDGGDQTGGMFGYIVYGATITDSFTNVTVTGGENVGGFVAFNSSDSEIARCYATGTVTGAETVGGFVGHVRESIIEQCYATGTVYANYSVRTDVGGFAGSVYDYAEVNDCYARGNVTGYNYVGNFVGTQGQTGVTMRCYATGHITGSGSYVHGFAGYRMSGCTETGLNYFDSTTTGTTSGCIGIPKTTTRMYQQSTYDDEGYYSEGWDFDYPVWTIDEGHDYPRLWWEVYYSNEDYAGGTGRAGDPFLIETAEQMNAIGTHPDDWDKAFQLIADIDLSAYTGEQFNMIGLWSVAQTPFTGTFDGDSHTISNFSYAYSGIYGIHIGIFSLIDDSDAEIKNLTLINPFVDGGADGGSMGSLVGSLAAGTVTNCSVTGGSVSGTTFESGGLISEVGDGGIVSDCTATAVNVTNTSLTAGGLVGSNTGVVSYCSADCIVTGKQEVGGLVGDSQGDGLIEYCSSAGTVQGDQHVGGLAGGNMAVITQCFSTATVNAAGTNQSDIGGLVGRNINGQIDNSFAVGDVTGGSEVGGLVGLNWSTSEPTTIDKCYAAGLVVGLSNRGGLVGRNTSGTITNSFWDLQATGQSASSGGGTALPTAEMYNSANFINAGWDFNTETGNGNDDLWCIEQGSGYPRLCVLDGVRYGGGTGTVGDPYRIITTHHLNSIGLNPDDFDKCFKLMNDLDLSGFTGNSFNLIGHYVGTSSSYNEPFEGIFDGGGHTISNFTYSNASGYVGLFSYVDSPKAEIRNLTLAGVNINASMSTVGALIGRGKATVINCHVEGSLTGDTTGGLVGYFQWGWIYDCSSTGTITGDNYVGGLIGDMYIGEIYNCYSTASITGNSEVGGLIGDAGYTQMETSYAAGPVSGTTNVGGLIGRTSWCSFTDCLWDQTVNSSLSGIGNDTDPNVTGCTTTQMQTENTFAEAGWDFAGEITNGPDNDWVMPDGGGYPILWWQSPSLPPLPGGLFAGSGTSEDPYQVSSVTELNCIGHNPQLMDKHFKLAGDVDLTGMNVFMLGGMSCPFSGTFDGSGFKISNYVQQPILQQPISFGYRLGLFQAVGASGLVKNLELTNPAVGIPGNSANAINGGLAACNYGTIRYCQVTGGTVGSDYSTGGLVGFNYGTISNCLSDTTVSGGLDIAGGIAGSNLQGGLVTESVSTSAVMGNYSSGGIVGINTGGTVSLCCGAGDVSGIQRTGGLAGENGGTVQACYSRGTVTADSYCGGLVGVNSGLVYPGTIVRCYSAALIMGEKDGKGGLIGINIRASQEACFWDSELNPGMDGISRLAISDPNNVTAQTTAEMMSASTFVSDGWDFDSVWTICEGLNYPRLQCLVPAADFLCPDGVDLLDLEVFVDDWMMTKMTADIDVAPDGGDGFVNLFDWQLFADAWQTTPASANWNSAMDIAPANGDGTVDLLDLMIFGENWLTHAGVRADIAPVPDGDGVVNLRDFAAFAEWWMLDTGY